MAGDGVLKVLFNNQYFQDIITTDSATTYQIREIPYTFIDVLTSDELPRRDAGDVARDRGD